MHHLHRQVPRGQCYNRSPVLLVSCNCSVSLEGASDWKEGSERKGVQSLVNREESSPFRGARWALSRGSTFEDAS